MFRNLNSIFCFYGRKKKEQTKKMSMYGSDWSTSVANSHLSSSDFSENKFYFRCLRTVHLSVFHLLLSLSIFITAIIFETKWSNATDCQTYYYLLYIRCSYWILTLILDTIITWRHNEIRRYGYHEFYRKNILNYKSAPLHVVTLWNMIIFLVQTIMQQTYAADFPLRCQASLRSPTTYLSVFCGLETIILIFVHGIYINRVGQFNRINCLPDALRDMEQPFIGTIGITIDKNNKISELLERQADLIDYLKQSNYHLNKKVLELREEIKMNR